MRVDKDGNYLQISLTKSELKELLQTGQEAQTLGKEVTSEHFTITPVSDWPYYDLTMMEIK